MNFKTLEELQAHNKKALEEIRFGKMSNQELSAIDEDGLTHFEKISLKSQPHHVFKLDWSTYYSIGFADTFLPKVGGYECKGVRFYDGAELLDGLQNLPRKLLALNDNNKLISIVTCTYPKNVETELKKDRVQPSNSEVCVFIEVDQSENADVYFKFGSDFKIFLEKQNIDPNQIENQSLKSDVETVKSHFNKTLSHENMLSFVLEKVGVETEKVYGNTKKGKLETFLRDNDIESFIYKNKCEKDKYIAIQGTIIEGWLELKRIDVSEIDKTTGLKLINKESFVVFKQKNVWIETGLAIPVNYNDGNCSQQEAIFTDSEIDHIAEQVKKQHKFTTLKGNEKLFNAINAEVEKKLANPFYKTVNLCVNVSVADDVIKEQNPKPFLDNNATKPLNLNSNQAKYISTFSNNEKECEISLNITIDANGKASIKHKSSPNYLKEFTSKWEQEIKKRGLEKEVDIEELRQQVIKDFEDAETENSFYENFIQNAKALLSDNIGGYLEAIQSTQKVAKNVWSDGTINQSTWLTSEPDHQEWPKYMQLNATVGGATDGVIDEIAGIPMAIKGIYGIATDEKQREALGKLFTQDGVKQLVVGLADDAKETLKDSDKLQHFAGVTTVAVAASLIGIGLFTKTGKIGDFLSKTTEKLKKFINPKTIKAIEELKDEIKYLPENKDLLPEFLERRKATKNFIERTETEILDEFGEDLSKIVSKGEDFTVLQKARNLPGVSSGKGKEIKGNWLKGKEGNAGLFPKSVADKLSGKNFANFDEFRAKFWKTVAEDENLIKDFSESNKTLMKQGNAPFPSKNQRLGGQETYQIHHKTPINQGGEVYNMDNLIIVTPRFHKEILSPQYHYGYGY